MARKDVVELVMPAQPLSNCPRCGEPGIRDGHAYWCLADGSYGEGERAGDRLMEPGDGRFSTEQAEYEEWDEADEQFELTLDFGQVAAELRQGVAFSSDGTTQRTSRWYCRRCGKERLV